MRLGQTIAEIRKETNKTQEEFAQIFHVTRQTVSNWENEKSYPDLQTLVNMSDEFGISLDVMLKEDKQMVKKINKHLKLGKLVKPAILSIVSVLAVTAGIWAVVWWNVKDTVEEKFQEGIEKFAFQYDEQAGYYLKHVDQDTYYTLPNQKMPGYLDFSLDFHAKALDCYTKKDKESLWIRLSERDGKGRIIVTVHREREEGEIWNTLQENEKEQYLETEPDIAELINEAEVIYDRIYR